MMRGRLGRPIDPYELYKPLRNQLRQLDLIDSLAVIRAYMVHLQYGEELPDDIEVPPSFLLRRPRLRRVFYEWELDTLLREVLINASDIGAVTSRDTFRQARCFADAINKIKDLENTLDGLRRPEDILLEMFRIAHRQFPWQRPPNATWLSRYYQIFGQHTLDAIIRAKLGVSTRELYLIGMGLIGHYFETFALNYPPEITVPGITTQGFECVLRHFATDINDLRDRARATQELNENYAYVFNPLRMHPLVRLTLRGKPAIAAPIPTFLLWRFTEGVYYEILNEPGFSDAYGKSVQAYVGLTAHRANQHQRFRIYAETEYHVGRDRKDTVDWVLEDESGLLFVESKAKRLRLQARTDIRSTVALDSELDKLAKFVVQVYGTIDDYRAGRYPELPFQRAKPAFPLVVTLEEWFSLGPRIADELNKRVVAHMAAAGLRPEYVMEMPYATCSIPDFESLVQVLDERPILEVMSKVSNDPSVKGWLVDSVLKQAFPAEKQARRNLFAETLDELTHGIATGHGGVSPGPVEG